jgi:hypothetical protein
MNYNLFSRRQLQAPLEGGRRGLESAIITPINLYYNGCEGHGAISVVSEVRRATGPSLRAAQSPALGTMCAMCSIMLMGSSIQGKVMRLRFRSEKGSSGSRRRFRVCGGLRVLEGSGGTASLCSIQGSDIRRHSPGLTGVRPALFGVCVWCKESVRGVCAPVMTGRCQSKAAFMYVCWRG